jgi:hypothetical protein
VKPLGWDLDGVFCDFNASFVKLIKTQTGVEIPQNGMGEWNYHLAAGVTKKQSRQLWKTIHDSRRFYSDLLPMQGAPEVLMLLQRWADLGVPSYFITSRSGKEAHQQSVRWLQSFGLHAPQVVLADGPNEKAFIARGLQLFSYVDDRPENVWVMEPKVIGVERLFLVDQPYNQGVPLKRGTRRVKSALKVLEILANEKVDE